MSDDEDLVARWECALEGAQAGDWDSLDFLIERGIKEGDEWLAPPRSIRAKLDAFLGNRPPRRGRKPRFDRARYVPENIRDKFRELTTEWILVLEEDRSLYRRPPLRAMQAYGLLANEYAISWEAVRDIVKGRHTYKKK